MRNLILLLTLFTLIIISSCKSPCEDINCLNNGTCDEGTCVCPFGYEGESCETMVCFNNGTIVDGECSCISGFDGEFCEIQSRLRFIGDYNVIDECNLTPLNSFPAEMTPSTQAVDRIIISNIARYNGATIYSKINGFDLDIPDQEIQGNPLVEGWRVEGLGRINSTLTRINLAYRVTKPDGDTDNCVATYDKLN